MALQDQALLVGGVLALGVVVLKPDLINNALGTNIPNIFGNGDITDDIDDDDDDLDDDRSPNTIADDELPKTLKAVNHYAGKIAGMITLMAERNIFDATQIKYYILDKHIDKVEHIAQLVDYEIVSIDFTNFVAMKEIAKLCIDVGQELKIEYKVNDALALEIIAGVGKGSTIIPSSSKSTLILTNVTRYLFERFNGSPVIRISGENEKAKKELKGNLGKAVKSFHTKKITGSAYNFRRGRYHPRFRGKRRRPIRAWWNWYRFR